MASSATPKKLRDVGLTEQYCTHRHHLNYYTCVVTSAFYLRRSKPWSPERALHLQQLVYEALHKLIPRHPMLSVTIQDEKTSKPWFCALDKVDLDRIVHVHDEERDMDEIAYHEMERDFKSEMQRGGPCWRVVVVPGTVDDIPGFWIVWAFHHALADGLGGFVFHRDLLRIFNSGEIDDPRPAVPSIVELASPVSKEQLIPPMEQLHKLPLGLGFILKAVCDEYLPFNSPDPKTWTCGDTAKPEYFTPPSSSPGLRTEVLTLRLPAEIMQGVINETRKKSTSVTALLETLLSLAFLEVFPNSDKIRVSIVVSMRRWLGNQLSPYGGADDVLGLYVTQFPEDFTRAAFQLRNPIPGIWNEAKRARATIDRVLSQSGKNTEGGLLRFVGNFDYFFKSKIGQRRADSIEISNVGVFKPGASGRDTWGIGDVRFSQSASVTGVAVECSIVTLEGGAMNIAFTWQEGLATREEMERVVDRTKGLLEMIGAEGAGK